jgi:cytochrome oxidase assembly protein ShyY1
VRRLGFLLRPGWIALVVGVIIFAGACFWVLSPWQFGRNSERSAQNNDVTNAVHDPAVPLRSLLPAGVEPRASQNWREVTMAGRFLPGDETVARLRQVSDQPADEVLTPFRLDSGRIMLVDRGWVSPNNGQVPNYPAAPTGHLTITARMHPEESDPHRPPLTELCLSPTTPPNCRHREVYSINTTVVSNLTGLSVDPGYFTLVDNQPGVLNVLPLPQIDSGPFLSYALQWIVFGVMAIGGLGYFTWREIQPGGALTPEGRARRRAEKAAGQPKVRGRRAVAAMIAEEEAHERLTTSPPTPH